ncbi:MAG: FAD-dependent tricarballylate dehydrogenase TcuA [Pseudomonadota bacterium]
MDEQAQEFDVVVVGGGNAGYSAASAAADAGANVLLLEKAPEQWEGGNSGFIAGFLFAYDTVDDLKAIVDFSPEDEASVISPYPKESFRQDMLNASDGRSDPELLEILVEESLDAMNWLKRRGFSFRLNRERMAHEIDGRYVYWGGALVGPAERGRGLMREHRQSAQRAGVTISLGAPVTGLVSQAGRVCGVTVDRNGETTEIRAANVVLACGGFEASSSLRARFLGEIWRDVKVRGTPYNTGDGFHFGESVNAAFKGDLAGCHATGWAYEAPDIGDLELTNRHSRNFYVFGVVVNNEGERFIDEGRDIRTHTYVEMGHSIAAQPGQIAYQVFDAKSFDLLNPLEYGEPAKFVEAETLEELARAAGLPVEKFLKTISRYNEAVVAGSFNPSALDDCKTKDLDPPKSHWARKIDTPPYKLFKLTAGITFTFGGLSVDADMRVKSEAGSPIEGLYAVGEMVGGLHYGNYAGGSGITFGVVSGRRAGTHAARRARSVV